MKLILSLIISLCLSQISFAKKKKRRRSKKSQVAVVQVDGAAVYKVPNFDSPIIAYLNKGKKIRASKKIYPGIGGLGSFYKVRLRKRKYGYITDVDLFPSGKKEAEDSSGGGDIFTASGGDDHTGQAMGQTTGRSMATKRYIGVSYNLVNYNEMIVEKEFNESIGFFGLKVSGPGALFVQLPLELNVLASFSPPKYYADSFNKASGFIILADVLYTMPLFAKSNYMLYVGVGPLVRYSSMQVELTKLSNSNSIPFDSQFINLGVSASAGFAFKLGESFAIKAEGKYMHDEQSHIVYGGAVQLAY